MPALFTTWTEWASTLARLPFATALRSSAWAYPAVEIVHLAGMALLFGSIFVVDMRLAGLGRRLPVSLLLRHALPFTVGAFIAVAASGVLLFVAHADELAANPAFLAKLGLIVLALGNLLWFHAGPGRSLHDRERGWDADAAPPAGARLNAILSIAAWLLVICAGRLIAYV
ncbi:conserved hypothetical protein; putative membrane protein [Cupriavidus taiwanensis]|uniref:DUF6644 family protein n=1 Tax=Cupriavidus taiwanensis TaxID=164546 RepID=UPI000E1A2218|nr:DUF6644 family protein [Cupriavidus taiwanensis]SOZ18439.1 conserved hypothetical protein; putative membrane protein [Cupriavidus taiwanensis]SOZ31510.1 conserved hypothetical protein; putative membrane protein [Cupriavidus taiwanensis]SOZ47471.1 conserved hypothetical protein; putative membrane protein [Cupriavidus taiwanensis]SPA02403.1 conserved hypothetical protein; putative membrane protein [Cupriavidus taiwanensis]